MSFILLIYNVIYTIVTVVTSQSILINCLINEYIHKNPMIFFHHSLSYLMCRNERINKEIKLSEA